MLLVNRWRVGPKLLLLAGVPIAGIFALSALVVKTALERAEAAAGLGSVEALAQLTDATLQVIDSLQWERAEGSYAAGVGEPSRPQVLVRQQSTDDALGALTLFLEKLDKQRLPQKLRQDLDAAYEQLGTLRAVRTKPSQPNFEPLGYLDYFAKANDSLIAATAAITELSSDKQLLVRIGGLVSAMQVIERHAREHALLNFVFGKHEFPPGAFRYYVTLLSEERVYMDSLRTWASEEQFATTSRALEGPFANAIGAMRQLALETTEGELPVQVEVWFETQRANMETLARVERAMADAVHLVVAEKVDDARAAVRFAGGLVLGVTLASVFIGWAITTGLTRSVGLLASAAETVHREHDFTLRAEKISNDELGLLTDAFNGMLAGIQARDGELDLHRQNLEALVAARTRELSARTRKWRWCWTTSIRGSRCWMPKGASWASPLEVSSTCSATTVPASPSMRC
jgi:two-component system, chemotaxis family, sensor kinase CheA